MVLRIIADFQDHGDPIINITQHLICRHPDLAIWDSSCLTENFLTKLSTSVEIKYSRSFMFHCVVCQSYALGEQLIIHQEEKYWAHPRHDLHSCYMSCITRSWLYCAKIFINRHAEKVSENFLHKRPFEAWVVYQRLSVRWGVVSCRWRTHRWWSCCPVLLVYSVQPKLNDLSKV